jgi:hypothetical protein
MPSPEQIKAAMPAMREWLVANGYGSHWLPGGLVELPADTVERKIEWCYLPTVDGRHVPGGVEQFIADQEGRG